MCKSRLAPILVAPLQSFFQHLKRMLPALTQDPVDCSSLIRYILLVALSLVNGSSTKYSLNRNTTVHFFINESLFIISVPNAFTVVHLTPVNIWHLQSSNFTFLRRLKVYCLHVRNRAVACLNIHFHKFIFDNRCSCINVQYDIL